MNEDIWEDCTDDEKEIVRLVFNIVYNSVVRECDNDCHGCQYSHICEIIRMLHDLVL